MTDEQIKNKRQSLQLQKKHEAERVKRNLESLMNSLRSEADSVERELNRLNSEGDDPQINRVWAHQHTGQIGSQAAENVEDAKQNHQKVRELMKLLDDLTGDE